MYTMAACLPWPPPTQWRRREERQSSLGAHSRGEESTRTTCGGGWRFSRLRAGYQTSFPHLRIAESPDHVTPAPLILHQPAGLSMVDESRNSEANFYTCINF